MGTMYATLISTFILSLFSRIAKDKKYRFLSIFWILITTTILIVFSGVRGGSIGDTEMYKHAYSLYASNSNLVKFSKDPGFTILNLILIQFSTNPQTLVFITALITNLFNMIVFYKYSTYLELQVYLYIAAGYFSVTMNGMRQCLAATIIFIFTKLLIKGDFKLYLFIILIVSTIHASALIMVPIYFIVREEAWSKRVIIMIILAAIGIIFYNLLSPILFKLLQNTQYGEYVEFNEGGSSFIRVIVEMVPIILAYKKRQELNQLWPESNIFVNMALINLVFVSFGIHNWIFNRFNIYIQLYNFILIPYMTRCCFNGKEKRLLYFGVVACYFIFFYREHVIGTSINYTSVLNLKDIFYK